MTWLLAATLAIGGDAAPAGREYQRGLRHLEQGRFDEAVRAFEAAIAFEAGESLVLIYRDRSGRHGHAYFPYYWLARARLGQAKRATSLDVRRQHLGNAIRLLGQTAHPVAEKYLAEANAALKKVDEAIAERDLIVLPPEVAALRNKVINLCNQELFEQALKDIEAASDLFVQHQRAKESLIATVGDRRKVILRRYEEAMSARLESASRTDPTLEAESILPILRPACVPGEVDRDPALHFRWLLDFFALYEEEIDHVRTASTLPPREILGSSAVFEEAAGKSLKVSVFSGYRAARNFGHCIRMARLKAHVAKGDPASAGYRGVGETILEAAVAAHAKSEQALRSLLEAEEKPTFADAVRKYLETDLPYQAQRIQEYRDLMEKVILAYEQRVDAERQVGQATEAFSRREVVVDAAACRKIQQSLSALESKPHFETLPGPVRARILFTRAVSTAVVAYLEAESPEQVADRCSSDLARAFALDAEVDLSWRNRLSPKILKTFEKARNK